MSTRELEQARARMVSAGEALRAMSRAERVERLARVLDAWSEESSPLRDALAREQAIACGFSEPTVRRGLEVALRRWTGDELRDLVRSELPEETDPSTRANGFPLTSVLLGGSIPMPSLQAILLPLVLGSPVLVKPASRDPVTPRHVEASLATLAPELAQAIALVPFESSDRAALQTFLSSPLVVATGSDETLRTIAAQVTPPQRLVAYGHRLSLAIVASDARRGKHLDEAAQGLALDIALWDQQGCLSPLAVHCIGNYEESLDVGHALENALSECERELPRGDPENATQSAIAQERSAARMRAAAGHNVAVLGEPGPFTVIVEGDATFRRAPLSRFVRVHPVADEGELLASVAPLAPHLAGISLAGSLTREGRDSLARLGVSRICRPGELQAPPFSWHHDGQPILTPLARFSDLEKL